MIPARFLLMTLVAVGWGCLPAPVAADAAPAVVSGAETLTPLLVDSGGRRIASASAWRAERDRLRRKWQEVLGAFPRRRAALKAEFLESESLETFSRQRVRYQVEPGVWVDGYLLKPRPARRRQAAVVVFHPTTPLQARGVAGLEAGYPEEKWQGVQLIRRGYVVWCPRNYIFTDGADWAGNAARVLERHPDWTGMTRMVWDAIRAADFVTSLPGVDARRLGCLGHSLGAKQVLYAMAFDVRYRAGVFSEGGIGLAFSNWDAPWYLGPRIRETGWTLDHHQLLALVAPRAFLLVAGGSADHAGSLAYVEAVRPVYRLLGAPENIVWLNHGGGHSYPPEAQEAAGAFLDRHLKR